MRSMNTKSHNTQDEKDFIDGLGSFGVYEQDREEMLEGYLMSAHKRVVWGEIDADTVVKYARESLDKLTKGIDHATV